MSWDVASLECENNRKKENGSDSWLQVILSLSFFLRAWGDASKEKKC